MKGERRRSPSRPRRLGRGQAPHPRGVFIKRSLATWLLLIASILTFDACLVSANAFSGYIGDSRVGIPFGYTVQAPVIPELEAPPSVDDGVDPGPLLANLATMGIIALVNVAFWPSRSPSKAPSTPSPIGGATPPVDVERRDEQHVALLDRRSRRCLRRTIVGSLLGLGWLFGGLGWLRGRTLFRTYAQHGRVPPWTAAAAWVAGRAVVCAVVVGVLGLLFAW